jgi:outer membrane autotransporter protein
MRCEPLRLPSTGPHCGATSGTGAGCKFVSFRLLAAIALFTVSTVSTHAQTNWTGAFSNGWFNPLNWNAGVPNALTSANIDTVTPNSTEIRGAGATALNLAVGQNGTGMLVIQNGGTLTDFGGFVGNLPGSLGTVTVSGAGSTWTNTGTLVVGGLGTGALTIQNGGTVNSGGGGSIGLSVGSTGTVTVTGPGSSWNNSPGGGLNIGSFGTGTLTITNGGMVVNNTAFTANVGEGAGSTGTVRVAGAGSTWSNSSGVNIGNLGTGTLTIAEGGIVTAPTVVIAMNVGSIGTLNIGAGAGNPAAAPGTLTAPSVAFGTGTGTINFNHTFSDYVFAPAITGPGTVNVLAGTTIFTGANSYSGATNVNAGTLRAGVPNTFSPNSAVTVASAGTLDLNGFNQTVSSLTNAGLVNMGTGTAPGTVLTTTSYIGTGGTIAMNTFLGADGSPSDKLIINSGSATGNSFLRITNAGGPGAETVANGIAVVQAINGGTTVPSAFALAGEVRGGAFDYDLFRGGLGGSSPNDWFLRSSFIVGPIPPEPPILPPILPPEPPPEPLPPGVYPIIGPEIATYGVVQPIARQLGMTTLGTLHDRIGDTLLSATTGTPCPADGDTRDGILRKAPAEAPTDCLNAGWGPSAWGRVLGQQIDNRYTAFADPRASGQLLGFQSGIDLWRGEWVPGHRDAAGIYVGYASANVDVSGLVTNEAATGYVLRHTGSLNLDAWSGAAYWTHYGPGDWYLDAVAQATHYEGAASTQFASLATTGFGILSSLEAGYPFRLPMFGPGFVLEPQAQIVWQRVSFDDANDGLGQVALGTTSGASGRIGLRGRWTVVSDSGQVWQPYVRANLWRDWGAQATTTFSGADLVPLLEQATRLQLGGGLSVRMNTNVSFYANADYQFSVSDDDRRNGIRGAAGVRYTW